LEMIPYSPCSPVDAFGLIQALRGDPDPLYSGYLSPRNNKRGFPRTSEDVLPRVHRPRHRVFPAGYPTNR
jgi:hypothetical protein